jgi:2,3-bisphosphoglycerate-independent phosphoglycerate mutase
MIKPVVLLILDGWGIAQKSRGNAVEIAKRPVTRGFWKKYPHTTLKAHGQYVGLPKGLVGNSEAGHINIGAGRLIKQDSVLISDAIKDGRFEKNLAINQTVEHVIKKDSALHVMGLISDGDSPHSSLDHLYSIVDLAYVKGVKKIYLHLITDGRDSEQFVAIKIISNVMKQINGQAELVSVIGRYYAMDRGKNWDRTKKAFDCLVKAKGAIFEDSQSALLHGYNQKITDEYIEPSIIAKNKTEANKTRIKSNDGIIFFNLRSDRARQLAKTFVQPQFNKMNRYSFRRGVVLKNVKFCALTDFGPDLDSILTAFPAPDLKDTLPIVLQNFTQVYMSETEKYAHVTYFINGGYADKIDGEARIHMRSKKIKSYSTQPEMNAEEITTNVNIFLEQDKYDFVCVNFANPDMVGHSGDLKATVKAIEIVDKCVGQIAEIVLRRKGALIVTSDHGNSEKMIDLKTDEVWGGHTTNEVPFMLVCEKLKKKKLKKGSLADIAPTVYDLFGIKDVSKKINKSLIK